MGTQQSQIVTANLEKGFFGGLFLMPFLRGGEDSGTERKKTKAYGSKGA
jgi:hypothetical protein